MKKLITISREYGSGGRIVGAKLAERIGVPFYDRENGTPIRSANFAPTILPPLPYSRLIVISFFIAYLQFK